MINCVAYGILESFAEVIDINVAEFHYIINGKSRIAVVLLYAEYGILHGAVYVGIGIRQLDVFYQLRMHVF